MDVQAVQAFQREFTRSVSSLLERYCTSTKAVRTALVTLADVLNVVDQENYDLEKNEALAVVSKVNNAGVVGKKRKHSTRVRFVEFVFCVFVINFIYISEYTKNIYLIYPIYFHGFFILPAVWDG